MTDQPNPAPAPVHFDWAPDVLKDKTVPVCLNREAITSDLRHVTCPKCMDGIVDIVNVWCRSVPREPA